MTSYRFPSEPVSSEVSRGQNDKLVAWRPAGWVEVVDETASRNGPRLDGAGAFRLERVDLAAFFEGADQPCDYVLRPYLPTACRVWAFGPTTAGKSIWAMWQGARASREGHRVVFISEENPARVDANRLMRLRPDPAHFDLLRETDIDLFLKEHTSELVRFCAGARLVILDTVSATWSGDESDNRAIANLDNNVLRPLTVAGTTAVVLDHTGHPQAFVKREGVAAGRGASSKAQKADVVLTFRIEEQPHVFRVEAHKFRPDPVNMPPPVLVTVRDLEDGSLELEETTSIGAVRISKAVETIVEIARLHPGLSTRQMREALKEADIGKDLMSDARVALEAEDPPRVRVVDGHVKDERGRPHPAKIWEPVGSDSLCGVPWLEPQPHNEDALGCCVAQAPLSIGEPHNRTGHPGSAEVGGEPGSVSAAPAAQQPDPEQEEPLSAEEVAACLGAEIVPDDERLEDEEQAAADRNAPSANPATEAMARRMERERERRG